jgi:stage II sporulation protein D
MTMRWLLTTALLLTLAGCATRRPVPQPRPVPAPSAPSTSSRPVTGQALRIEIGARGSGRVQAVPLEEYVRDVVVSEISVGAGDAALAPAVYEAQAIVARTYAIGRRGRHDADGFDLCSTTHCQVYRPQQWRQSRWAAIVDAAVRRSRGLILLWQGRPIEAVFHAHCGGHTSDAVDVWRGGNAPYLRGIPDPFCVRERPVRWSWRTALADLQVALNLRPHTVVGERLDGVQVVRRDAGGRAADVLLSGVRAPIVSGEDMRLAVLARYGASSLQSTRFDVRRERDAVVFDGTGAGHGVGLCQTGLIGRIRARQGPVAVLEAYYPGARVGRLTSS